MKNPDVFNTSGIHGLANACPAKGNLPLVGFKPTMPQLCAGLRMLPPESDPVFC